MSYGEKLKFLRLRHLGLLFALNWVVSGYSHVSLFKFQTSKPLSVQHAFQIDWVPERSARVEERAVGFGDEGAATCELRQIGLQAGKR